MYHIDRTILELGHTPFNDGSHIIYVNGEFQQEGHPVGEMMHDFFCSNPEDMHDTVLKERVRYFKKSRKGRKHMCEIFDELIKEGEQNMALQTADKMIRGNEPDEKITAYTGLPEDQINERRRLINASV